MELVSSVAVSCLSAVAVFPAHNPGSSHAQLAATFPPTMHAARPLMHQVRRAVQGGAVLQSEAPWARTTPTGWGSGSPLRLLAQVSAAAGCCCRRLRTRHEQPSCVPATVQHTAVWPLRGWRHAKLLALLLQALTTPRASSGRMEGCPPTTSPLPSRTSTRPGECPAGSMHRRGCVAV